MPADQAAAPRPDIADLPLDLKTTPPHLSGRVSRRDLLV
ncbi:MAG: hypothetical protein QOC73_1015, partial [Actinomycetota bacterium]|nr:hypothetical protein [Actinomycetota bacterium]